MLLTIVFALAGGAKWVYEYTKNLKWQRAKFLSEKMKEFFTDPEIKKALVILDWNSAKIEMANRSGEKIEYKFDDYIIMEALTTHDKKHSFTFEERQVRNLFDYFFDRLSEINVWIETGLIEEKQAKIYLKYWIDIIKGNRKSKSRNYTECLQKYLDFYNFEGAKKLIYDKA